MCVGWIQTSVALSDDINVIYKLLLQNCCHSLKLPFQPLKKNLLSTCFNAPLNKCMATEPGNSESSSSSSCFIEICHLSVLTQASASFCWLKPDVHASTCSNKIGCVVCCCRVPLLVITNNSVAVLQLASISTKTLLWCRKDSCVNGLGLSSCYRPHTTEHFHELQGYMWVFNKLNCTSRQCLCWSCVCHGLTSCWLLDWRRYQRVSQKSAGRVWNWIVMTICMHRLVVVGRNPTQLSLAGLHKI